jgi:hypothetical protein
MKRMKKLWAVIWCHRMVYAGLAGTYGALCFGLLDKSVVEVLVAALYLVLVVQK